MEIRGRIIKGIGGFYYVNGEDNAVYECKARGKFRREKVTPMVGDRVEFTIRDGYNSIEDILPRRNSLKRPMVANIDKLVLVMSAGKPAADLLLCDKLLIQAYLGGIEPLIVISKADIDRKNAQALRRQYACYDAIFTSVKSGEGLDAFKEKICGLCVCLAGQSAVGKSSLLNAVDPSFRLETGGLSKKTDRGKHTTRSSELFYVGEADAYVVDTPGFSMYEAELDKFMLTDCYPEMNKLKGQCRFSSCLHDKEPDCAVKAAVEAEEINKERYDRYLRIIHSLEEK